MPDKKIVYTIGHSTHNFDKFVFLLKKYKINLVADIRTIPRSRHNPQFNKELISKNLARAGIKYIHLEKLGGLRKPNKNSLNTAWENAAFRGYADYMQTNDFSEGINKLRILIEKDTVVILCAEGLWWRCHRRLVSDALISKGINVFHIMPGGKAFSHKTTLFAKARAGKITYPKR